MALNNISSIFVCFMCEAEYKDVDLLNEHMKEHSDVPEMSIDFPKRKRRPGTESNSMHGSDSHKKVKLGSTSMSSSTSQRKPDKIISSCNSVSSKPKTISVTSKPIKKEVTIVSDIIKTNHTSNGSAASKESIVKEESVPDSVNKSALRMQRMILAREKRQLEQDEKKTTKTSIVLSAGNNSPDHELEEVQELLDSEGLFNNESSSASHGPIVMTGEPENFSVPAIDKKMGYFKTSRRNRFSNYKMSNISSSNSMSPQVRNSTDSNDDDDDDKFNSSGTMEGYSNSHNISQEKLRAVLQVQEIMYETVGDDEDDVPVLCYEDKRIPLPVMQLSELGINFSIKKDSSYDTPGGSSKSGRSRSVSQNQRRGMPGRRTQPRDANIDGDFECEECGKMFRSNTTLKVHMKAHFENKNLPCPHCDQVFPQRHILQQHLIEEHPTYRLVCQYCQKIFTREDTLRSHLVRMHETEGGLNCNVCGKNFPSQGQLEAHIRVHTGERPFKCQLCSRAFVQKIHLRTHLRTMHQTTDAPTTPCHLCDAMVYDRIALRDHAMLVHGLNHTEYRAKINALRREGKINEAVPAKVKVVDPSFRYKKVSVEDLEEEDSRMRTSRGKRSITSKVFIDDDEDDDDDDDDDDDSDGMMIRAQVMRRRDQEELKFVESAFKVADEMDQQVGGGIVSSSITPVYYSSSGGECSNNSSDIVTTAGGTETLLSSTTTTTSQQHSDGDTVVMFTM